MDLDVTQLPIPDWGLHCPICDYPLVGLPTHRCPECGTPIDVAALVRPWTRLRAPWFSGRELPVPDFGLQCAGCGEPLAGAPERRCPACGGPFDLEHLRPRRRWFLVDAELCGDLPVAGVQALFSAEYVPHVPVMERTIGEIWGGASMMINRLRVPSEFYFDVLWLLRRAREEMDAARTAAETTWHCRACGEENPGHFEICWNCRAGR